MEKKNQVTPESKQILVTVGNNLRKYRKQKNLTLQEVCDACGFEQARLSRLENGRANATLLSLGKICSALEIELSQLFAA